MYKTVMVVIPVEKYENGRTAAETIEGNCYKNKADLEAELLTYGGEGESPDEPLVLSELPQFTYAANENIIDFDGSWLTFIKLQTSK